MAIPKEHEHVPFLTQMIVLVSNLGFQSKSEHYERPCKKLKIQNEKKKFALTK